jgi:hypothetical protein
VAAAVAVSMLYEVIGRYDQRLNDEKAFGIEEMAYSRLMNNSATLSRPVNRGFIQHWAMSRKVAKTAFRYTVEPRIVGHTWCGVSYIRSTRHSV